MSSAGEEVLITGQSGTGQSNLIANLAALSFKAVDTDDGRCEPQPDGRQRWREDAIQELLATEDTGVVFVAGCEENQVKFHPWFDHIILGGRLGGKISPAGANPGQPQLARASISAGQAL